MERNPADRGKARGVSSRQRQRIGHAHRAGPMHGAAENRRQRRLERPRRIATERDIGDAEFLREFEFARLRRESGLGAVELEPAAADEIARGAGLGHQRLVLGDRARKQRPHELRGLDQSRRLRSGAECRKPRRDPRQKRDVIIRLRRAFERDAQKLIQSAGKAGGKIVLPSMMPALP